MNPLIPIETWVPLMIALIAGVLLTAKKTSGKLPRPWNLLSPALRLAAVLCMGILLLNPGEFRPLDAEVTGNAWILLDRSASMGPQSENSPTRWERGAALLRTLPETPHARHRILPFAESLEAEVTAEELSDLSADGEGTDMLRALRAALDRAQSDPSPSRGILLLTDGIQTAAHADPSVQFEDLALRARSHRIPISAKMIGAPLQRPDLELRPHQDLLTVTAGSERAVRGNIRSRHLPDLRKPVRLLNAQGEVVDETRLSLPAESDVPFVLNTGPLEAGMHTFRLEVEADESEARVDNNAREIRVNAVEVRLNVLLLEGVPHWDSKFLAQWFRGRQGIQLTTLHRLAENRYFFVGPDSDTPEAGDHARLPGERDDFREFDLILVGRGLDYMSSSQTTAALHRFVRDHGGVLIFTRGRPVTADRPALESLLPVEWRDELGGDRVARPTPAGARSGLFGDLLPGRDSEVWAQLPALRGLRRLNVTDGMATVLLEAAIPGRDDAWPVMVSRRYGHGQLLLVNGEGMWHWDFQATAAVEDRWYGDFWTQVMLWTTQAARFQPGQTWSVDWRPQVPEPGHEIDFSVERRLERETPATEAPRLRIQPEDGPSVEVPLYPEGRGNRLLGRWTPDAPGLYSLVVLEEEDATPVDSPRLLSIPAPPGELDRLDPSPSPLRELVESSGGRWIEDDEIHTAFLDPETDPAAPSGEAVWHPHWTKSWILLAMISLPGVEGGVRRRKGLI